LPHTAASAAAADAAKAGNAAAAAGVDALLSAPGTVAIYTDGSCLGNGKRAKAAADGSAGVGPSESLPAGWGAVVLAAGGGGRGGGGQGGGGGETVLAELYGPVVLDPSSPLFVGRCRGHHQQHWRAHCGDRGAALGP
jgi:hypothetical protein